MGTEEVKSEKMKSDKPQGRGVLQISAVNLVYPAYPYYSVYQVNRNEEKAPNQRIYAQFSGFLLIQYKHGDGRSE